MENFIEKLVNNWKRKRWQWGDEKQDKKSEEINENSKSYRRVDELLKDEDKLEIQRLNDYLNIRQ